MLGSTGRKARKKRNHKTKWGYIFLTPWFLFFFVFTIYPFLYGIVVSFTDYNLAGMHFTGFENFINIFSDPAFMRSLVASAFYAAIIIPGTIVLSMWIANTLRGHGPKMNALAKVVFYLPGVTCQTALVISWKFLLSPSYGISATIFQSLGLTRFSLFDRISTSIPTLSILIIMCSIGQAIILFSAAMNGIPTSYYEAAELEGARRGQQFFKITLPLMNTTTTFVLITETIGILQVFVVPYLMTDGGPQYRTSTLLLMIYKSAFQNNSFGYASAIGVVLFIITAAIAVLQFRAMRREIVEY